MLLQHQTSSLLSSQPSPAWEEEMTFRVGERPRGGTKKGGKKGRGVKEESCEGEGGEDEGDKGSVGKENVSMGLGRNGFSDEDEHELDE